VETTAACPQCGVPWTDGRTCRDDFDQMLYWENEVPENGAVHHLMVFCFHIQHPEKSSPEGLYIDWGALTGLKYLFLVNLRSADRSLRPLARLKKLVHLRTAYWWPVADFELLRESLPALRTGSPLEAEMVAEFGTRRRGDEPARPGG